MTVLLFPEPQNLQYPRDSSLKATNFVELNWSQLQEQLPRSQNQFAVSLIFVFDILIICLLFFDNFKKMGEQVKNYLLIESLQMCDFFSAQQTPFQIQFLSDAFEWQNELAATRSFTEVGCQNELRTIISSAITYYLNPTLTNYVYMDCIYTLFI